MRYRTATTALLCFAAAVPITSLAQSPAPPAAPANCTDVQVGTAQSYDCINAQLGAVAHGTQRFSSDANAPISSNSPSNAVGTFNQSATANRLGQNFGKSVTPYRPAYTPPPAFGTPR